MTDYSRFFGDADVKTVSWKGSDLILELRDIGKIKPFFGMLFYRSTVTFVNVTRIKSLDLRNDLIEHDIDEVGPGWKLDGISFDGEIAGFGVGLDQNHETSAVRYRISCSALDVRTKLELGKMVRGWLRQF
jgi:hypothetical protein